MIYILRCFSTLYNPWIIQGGQFGGGAGVLEISLPISMIDINYNLIVNANVSDGSYFGTGYKVSSSKIWVWTTNYQGTNNRQYNSTWQVIGYASI